MAFLEPFAEILKLQEPLAPYTYFKLGGPAQALAQPRSPAELVELLAACRADQIPFRLLGGGCNLLVRDEGVTGVVVRLNEPVFTQIDVKGNRVRAGAGASLNALISHAARHSLAGVESLVGIPGTVGGAIRANVTSRSGDIRQMLRQVEVMDARGNVQSRDRDDLHFGPQAGGSDDTLILTADFELEADNPDTILKRMRKLWIQKKTHQPLSFQPAGRIFKDPRGQAAELLLEQAGLSGTRVGGAEVCDRNANFIITHPGATARDVLRLIDLMRSKVAERLGQSLQLDLVVW